MDLKTRIEKVLSEILTDKYGEEYGVKIALHFERKGGTESEES